MADAYRGFPCSISTVDSKIDIDNISRKTAETEIWYCDNLQKKFAFDELETDIDGMLVCPICGSSVEPITEDD